MSEILTQLGLDQTFFTQFILIVGLYFVLSIIFFKPFQKLLEARHKKTVQEREEAERTLNEVKEKLAEYEAKIQAAHQEARRKQDSILLDAKNKENEILNSARNEAKQVTQTAIQALNAEKEKISKTLEVEVEKLAQDVSSKLLLR